MADREYVLGRRDERGNYVIPAREAHAHARELLGEAGIKYTDLGISTGFSLEGFPGVTVNNARAVDIASEAIQTRVAAATPAPAPTFDIDVPAFLTQVDEWNKTAMQFVAEFYRRRRNTTVRVAGPEDSDTVHAADALGYRFDERGVTWIEGGYDGDHDYMFCPWSVLRGEQTISDYWDAYFNQAIMDAEIAAQKRAASEHEKRRALFESLKEEFGTADIQWKDPEPRTLESAREAIAEIARQDLGQ